MIKNFFAILIIGIVVFASNVSNTSNSGVSLRFMAFGDWGFAERIDKIDAINLFIQSQQEAVQAVFLLGDNFYPLGIDPLLGLNDPQFRLFSDHLARNLSIPFCATLGNHDYLYGPAGARLQRSYNHSLWEMPSRLNFVQFEIPDSDGMLACFWTIDSVDIRPSDLDDLDWHMSRSEKQCLWKILAAHYPPVTTGSYRNDPILAEFREKIVKPFHEKYYFDLILGAHEHSSQIINVWDTYLLISGASVETRPRSIHPTFEMPDGAELMWGDDTTSNVVLLLDITHEQFSFKFVDISKPNEQGILVEGIRAPRKF